MFECSGEIRLGWPVKSIHPLMANLFPTRNTTLTLDHLLFFFDILASYILLN